MTGSKTVKGRRQAQSPSQERGKPEAETGVTRAGGPEPLPERIGPYRILEVLGEGGMGTVYLAEQTEGLKRRVALKLVRPTLVEREAFLRFKAERQALARMNHPNIAQVFEAGTTDDGQPYIAMEYVPGRPITGYCDRRRPEMSPRLELLIAVGEGIAHAHRRGIIHRDIKPSNVLVMEDQGRPIVKIIDFGIAKLTDATTPLTKAGAVLGTVAYMSPEQIRGAPVDHRTDVFSFGVLMYELLTHRLPFNVPAVEATLWRDYPPELERIVNRCLEKDPDRRYPDFSEVIAELEALLRELAAVRSAATSVDDPGELLSVGERKRVEELEGELEAMFTAAEDPEAQALLEILEDAVSLSPAVVHAVVLRACRWQHERDRRIHAEATEHRLIAAAACYHLGFALGPQHPSAPEVLEEAAETYREAIELDPEGVEAGSYSNLGDVLTVTSRFVEAAAAYRKAVELDPTHVPGHYGLAIACLKNRSRLDEALTACWKTVELDPVCALAHNNLGITLGCSRETPGISRYGQDPGERAVTAFEEAIALDPELVPVYGNLGLALLKQGKSKEAGAAFRKVIAVDGESELARLLSELSSDPSGRALAEAVAAERLVPREILPYTGRGSASRAVAELGDGVDCLSRGLSLAREGRLDDARNAFAEAERIRRQQGY
ncbi:MAG: protein kinase [bacterium]|nr:protein kinase [bacterium]